MVQAEATRSWPRRFRFGAAMLVLAEGVDG